MADELLLSHEEWASLSMESRHKLDMVFGKTGTKRIVPTVKRATGRTIPDVSGMEHVCEWQQIVKSREVEEEIALKNLLVNAFVQGAKWMAGPHPSPTPGWIGDEAERRFREGSLGVDELTKVSIEHGDFGGCE